MLHVKPPEFLDTSFFWNTSIQPEPIHQGASGGQANTPALPGGSPRDL